MKWVSMSMVAAYPLLAHAAVWFERPQLQWLALLVLISVPLLPALAARRRWAWLLLPGIALALYGVTRAGGGLYALYLPSLAIPGLLMWAFGSTLLAGRRPLITRMAQAQHSEPLPPEVVAYTRRLTQLWTALFAVMIVESASLALLGETHLWSLMTNFVNYLVAGAFFVLEYPYRCWRFPQREHQGFLHYLSSTVRYDLRST